MTNRLIDQQTDNDVAKTCMQHVSHEFVSIGFYLYDYRNTNEVC